MQVSDFIENAHTVEVIVDAINANRTYEYPLYGTIDISPEQLAVEYAYVLASEQDDIILKEDLEAHLDILIEYGAEFDYFKALSKFN